MKIYIFGTEDLICTPICDQRLKGTERNGLMSDKRFLVYAAVFEGGMAVVALGVGWVFGMNLLAEFHFNGPGVLHAILATLPLLIGYHVLKLFPWKCLKKVEQVVRLFFRQYMVRLNVFSLAWVAALAGIGEEMLFRGLLQRGTQYAVDFFGGNGSATVTVLSIIFLVSVFFAAAHAVSTTYFVLAFLISLYLGVLYWQTGNLLVPILVHGFYDFYVFLVLKRALRRPENPSVEAVDAIRPRL